MGVRLTMAICGYCKDRGEVKELHGLGVKPCPKCRTDASPLSALDPSVTARAGLQRARTQRRAQGISRASTAQRKKVAREGVCRNCGADKTIAPLDPAHIVGRDLGGCDHEDCVCVLCRICHGRQEEGRLDVLRLLTLVEQSHGVSHVGAISFIHLATGERYTPERKPS